MSEPSRLPLVATLGVLQIFAWGSTYYLPAVLAPSIVAETGWNLPFVIGGTSIGLLAAGLVSPRVGRAIGQRGGKPILALSAMLFAAGLAIIGAAPALAVYVAGWLVLGAGMGCGLYDAAFATLGRLYGTSARRSIGILTLFGGFASTVCWPLTAALNEWVGWRGTCLAYAGLHLAISLPIYLWRVPDHSFAADQVERNVSVQISPEPRLAHSFAALILLGCVMMLCMAIGSAVSVYLLSILHDRGFAPATAVAIAGMLGPAQVGARVIELALGQRHHPIWTMVVAIGLIALGFLLFLFGGTSVIGLALIFYGAGNGIYSIARGTLPLILFGATRYPVLIGKLAFPALIASALSPLIGALIVEWRGTSALLGVLGAIALINVALVALLAVLSRRTITA